MKKLLLILLFLPMIGFGQNPSSNSDSWWIFFKNKDCYKETNDIILNVALSPKAIKNREIQSINLDNLDIKICQSYLDILKKEGLVIKNQSRWLNAVSIYKPKEFNLRRLLKYDFISYYKPVKRLTNMKKLQLITTDFVSSHKSSALSYGPSFNQIDMLGGVDLHNQGYLGDGITIAVFDAGFTNVNTLPIFDSLWLHNRISNCYDFVDNTLNVFHSSSHGTMVLSTMGGFMEDSLIGTAPHATYMLFRTEDTGSETIVEEDNWVAAAEYSDSVGVHIINSSLGYTIYNDSLDSHSYADMDGNTTIITNAADLAASRGILVINSAGNSGNNNWHYIGAPADGDSVLAIGAVDAQGNSVSFSSRGPSFDGRVKPNVCALGYQAVVAASDSTIQLASGTSFSSPILSGLAACLWQYNITANNMQIFSLIEQSAHLFSNPNDSLGFGIPNFSNIINPSLISSPINENFNRRLIYVSDFLGRRIKEKKNQPLFYIYDDGTVEKRIVIE